MEPDNLLLFRSPPSDKFRKKLVGERDIEDALRRLDQLTREEVWMAYAEILKITHGVDKMREIDDKVKESSTKSNKSSKVCEVSLMVVATILSAHMIRSQGIKRDSKGNSCNRATNGELDYSIRQIERSCSPNSLPLVVIAQISS